MALQGRDARVVREPSLSHTISNIPRPASGTSRYTMSVRRSSKSCLTTPNPLLSPDKARRPQRRSIAAKSENPPSLFHLPRDLLPRSESLLSQLESFSSIVDISETPTRPEGARRIILKSQTTPALLSPGKQILSHGLLKPIGPHLPRSSTYDDLLSPSLKKTVAQPLVKMADDDMSTSKKWRDQESSNKPASAVSTSRSSAKPWADRLDGSAPSRPSGDSGSTSTDNPHASEIDPSLVSPYN